MSETATTVHTGCGGLVEAYGDGFQRCTKCNTIPNRTTKKRLTNNDAASDNNVCVECRQATAPSTGNVCEKCAASETGAATARPLHAVVSDAIAEDWELVKDTAGKVADRKSVFDLAFKFGWHAATKYLAESKR